MTRDTQLVTDDREERVVEVPRRRSAGRIVLIFAAVIALAVAAFLALGGTADVDTEGDFEVPEVDVDVNPPGVDVDTEDAPPAQADAG